MQVALLSFLEAIRRGSGTVDASYAGWFVPRDQHELAILDASGAPHVRLAGWVRDDLSDLLADLAHRGASAKDRSRLAEVARYYLRPIGPKDTNASRVTLSNWRHDAIGLLAEQLLAPNSTALTFGELGELGKGERLSLSALASDPAVGWLLRLDPQERDVATHRALSEAAQEARSKADARMLIGVALIASRFAPETNPEPVHDHDGTPLRGLDTRKFTRSRLALPIVLACLHRAAKLATSSGQPADLHAVLVEGLRLVDSPSGQPSQLGPLANMDTESTFDRELLQAGIWYAWEMIASADGKPILAELTRYAALASGMLTAQNQQDLALLSVAVARRHSERRALNIDLHHPAFRSDTPDAILFQLRFRRERLLLASHHNPGHDWQAELTAMTDLLAVRKRFLPAADSRRTEKVQLHLHQGILLRRARDLSAAGRPMDVAAPALTDHELAGAVHAVERMIESMGQSFRIANEDSDPIAAVNAHRRKTEAEGVVHLLSRVANPDALASARRLRRELNRLDDVYADQLTDLRMDVNVLWLLAMADQAVRHNETEQARHYLNTALADLPAGIPHLAIRSASVAASIGEHELAANLIKRVPQGTAWPSYLRHLVQRLHQGQQIT